MFFSKIMSISLMALGAAALAIPEIVPSGELSPPTPSSSMLASPTLVSFPTPTASLTADIDLEEDCREPNPYDNDPTKVKRDIPGEDVEATTLVTLVSSATPTGSPVAELDLEEDCREPNPYDNDPTKREVAGEDVEATTLVTIVSSATPIATPTASPAASPVAKIDLEQDCREPNPYDNDPTRRDTAEDDS